MSIGQNHGKFFKGAVVKNDGKFGKALDVNGSDIAVQISSLAKILKKFLKGPILYLNWLYVREGCNHSGVWIRRESWLGGPFHFSHGDDE